jgi:hypothetical protein
MTRTTANFKDSKVWDRAVYVERAKRCVRCFSCEPLFVELQKPPTVDDEFWNQWFGSDPGSRMQNGGIPLEKPVYDALTAPRRSSLRSGSVTTAAEGAMAISDRPP